jgi:hypothetical protein
LKQLYQWFRGRTSLFRSKKLDRGASRSVCTERTVQLTLILLACAAACQLTPSGDSCTRTAPPTKNFGAATTFGVENFEPTFIQFNLASIPSGYTAANITQATLKLYLNSVTTAGSFNVDYIHGTWTGSTIDASHAPAPGAAIAANVPPYIELNVTEAVKA